jgi:hypothetical protein
MSESDNLFESNLYFVISISYCLKESSERMFVCIHIGMPRAYSSVAVTEVAVGAPVASAPHDVC